MKSLILFLLLSWSINTAWAQNDSTKVLFIGNSITYFNNMPQMFHNISNNKGRKVSIATHTPGGTGIVNHYVNQALFTLIASKKWDIVILQPGSSESAGVSYPVDTTVKRARILLDKIYKNNPCTRVYLYEIPYGIPTSGYSQYFQVQTMIRDSVSKMADSLHLQMLPAGESFRAYYSKYQNLLLHSSVNNIHPNAFGSYLVACTFYTGIFQDSVTNCSYYSSIPIDTANNFFAIADSVVLKNKASWRINTYNLHADFTLSQNGKSVTLTNKSVNFQSLNWSFGDGNTSTSSNPTHSYTNDGNYKIKLIAENNGCADSTLAKVSINTTGFKNITDNSAHLRIFPNPVVDRLNIKSDKPIHNISIYNSNGQQVFEVDNIHKLNFQIAFSQYPKGVYIVIISSNSETYVNRIVR